LNTAGAGRSGEPDRCHQLQHHTSNEGFGSIQTAIYRSNANGPESDNTFPTKACRAAEFRRLPLLDNATERLI
jgi:hypothetical protein